MLPHISVTQVMNLKLTEEVERFESMLKLQSGINRDLHKELEVLIHKRDSDKKIHAKRAGTCVCVCMHVHVNIYLKEASLLFL